MIFCLQRKISSRSGGCCPSFLRWAQGGRMSNAGKTNGFHAPKMRKQIEVLVVQSNPADTLLTVEAFKAAGVTSGLRCVEDGEDALDYVCRTGKYSNVRIPDLIFL